jgi:hypothetical protein
VAPYALTFQTTGLIGEGTSGVERKEFMRRIQIR